MSHHKELADDAEDIPSDFFDDFNKEEFMEGLSVIDSWDDDGGKPRGSRINAEAIDSVRDLRELIGDGREEDRSDKSYKKRVSRDRYGSGSKNLDDYIKPGSRRDPSKTNEAIKRDKQVKVKEYLAKKIEGGDDLRPPGTELDDYMDDSKLMEKKHTTGERSQSRRSVEKQQRRESAEKPRRESPLKQKRRKISRSPRRSPKRSPRHSPRRSPRRSPVRKRVRPSGFRRSRSPRRFSPPRYDRYERRERSRSPRRDRSRSPRRDRSRSPRLDRYGRRSPGYRDSFLYPNDPQPFPGYHSDPYGPQPDMFPGPIMEYPGGAPPGYPFQPASFSGGFPGPYEFGPQPIPQEMLPPAPMPVPQPVPAPMSVPGPMMVPEPVPIAVPPLSSISLPSSAPSRVSPAPGPKLNKDQKTPFDALAQLVAEGKLSQEDYLKLAPNKSKSARFVDVSSSVETKARVEVLNRCSTAMSKLANLRVPSHLVINLSMLGPEPKALHPKYCSPLKRQATTEFFFTTPSATAAAAHNRQLIDGVISAVGLTNVVARPKKKTPKNMKDAACQTTKPYCDVCEIREATRCYDTATSIDPEHFSSTVHTQVLEQDLLSSKAMFTPSGSIGEGAPMSIAHLTPAQLVSQLAARAKTLKQSEPSPPAGQFGRRPPNYDYDNRDYDSRGGQQYQNYNNNYNRY